MCHCVRFALAAVTTTISALFVIWDDPAAGDSFLRRGNTHGAQASLFERKLRCILHDYQLGARPCPLWQSA